MTLVAQKLFRVQFNRNISSKTILWYNLRMILVVYTLLWVRFEYAISSMGVAIVLVVWVLL